MEPVKIKEHESLQKTETFDPTTERNPVLKEGHCVDEANDRYFIIWDTFNKNNKSYKSTYIIGAQWIKYAKGKKPFPLIVEPKLNFDKNDKDNGDLEDYEKEENDGISNDSNETTTSNTEENKYEIDFIKMFSVCLNSGIESESFSKIYGINFNEPTIKTKTTISFFTPILIAHFLSVVKKIAKQGLKKGYITKTENLNKIKGKIEISLNEQANIRVKRFDRTYCTYQDYSVDIPENRLIKKALIFCKHALQLEAFAKNQSAAPMNFALKKCLATFENVSDQILLSEIKSCKKNKIYKNYNTAIDLAKMILRRYDFSLSNMEEKEKSIPPFWIDMSLLFEHYVLGLLREVYGDEIRYQKGTRLDKPDFYRKSTKEDERIILDTKYKRVYQKTKGINKDDIRQLSGYARSIGILKKMDFTDAEVNNDFNEIVPCVILYPATIDESVKADADYNVFEEDKFSLNINKLKELGDENKITEYVKFYKIPIPLPLL